MIGFLLCFLLISLAAIFAWDGFLNKFENFSLINYGFSLFFMLMLFIINRLSYFYYSVCDSLIETKVSDGRRLGFFIGLVYLFLLSLFLMGGFGVVSRLLSGQHIFG